MKRSGIKRKTALKPGEKKLQQGKPLKRTKGLSASAPRPRPRRPEPRGNTTAKALFRDPQRTCRAPGCTRKVVHDHHAVLEQTIRKARGDVWDPRCALGLCFRHHELHHHPNPHTLAGRLPLSCLRDENFAFARELLGGDAAYLYLSRRYLGSDPRLEALLS